MALPISQASSFQPSIVGSGRSLQNAFLPVQSSFNLLFSPKSRSPVASNSQGRDSSRLPTSMTLPFTEERTLRKPSFPWAQPSQKQYFPRAATSGTPVFTTWPISQARSLEEMSILEERNSCKMPILGVRYSIRSYIASLLGSRSMCISRRLFSLVKQISEERHLV